MLQSLISWLIIPIFGLKTYFKAAADAEIINEKIRQIDTLPV